MRRALRLHPEAERGPVTRIEVEIARRRPATLAITYELAGRIQELCIPSPATPERTDGLWRHTCFEAFLRPAQGAGYLEINLSPSGQWAAYRFGGYRASMSPLEALSPPVIEVVATPQALTLRSVIDLGGVPELAAGDWRLGLSAVIEDAAGSISYWALAHPAGKPDFHHADGFACQVRAPEDA